MQEKEALRGAAHFSSLLLCFLFGDQTLGLKCRPAELFVLRSTVSQFVSHLLDPFVERVFSTDGMFSISTVQCGSHWNTVEELDCHCISSNFHKHIHKDQHQYSIQVQNNSRLSDWGLDVSIRLPNYSSISSLEWSCCHPLSFIGVKRQEPTSSLWEERKMGLSIKFT